MPCGADYRPQATKSDEFVGCLQSEQSLNLILMNYERGSTCEPHIAAGMVIVVSDLDGTLLDHESYSFDGARQALAALDRRRVPLIICTSKTRAETEHWRRRLGNYHPFIVENGGAVFIPRGYFGDTASSTVRDGYHVLELGRPYCELVAVLHECAGAAGCAVRGFHDMTPAEISLECGLTLHQAELASRREYDEPFTIGNAGLAEDLLSSIDQRGYRSTRGGRFYHITGSNDKASAVSLLIDLYRRRFGHVHSVGLGDGLNDAGFLNTVELPVLMPSRQFETLHTLVPRARIAGAPGPAGWNSAVLNLLSQMLPD